MLQAQEQVEVLAAGRAEGRVERRRVGEAGGAAPQGRRGADGEAGDAARPGGHQRRTGRKVQHAGEPAARRIPRGRAAGEAGAHRADRHVRAGALQRVHQVVEPARLQLQVIVHERDQRRAGGVQPGVACDRDVRRGSGHPADRAAKPGGQGTRVPGRAVVGDHHLEHGAAPRGVPQAAPECGLQQGKPVVRADHHGGGGHGQASSSASLSPSRSASATMVRVGLA